MKKLFFLILLWPCLVFAASPKYSISYAGEESTAIVYEASADFPMHIIPLSIGMLNPGPNNPAYLLFIGINKTTFSPVLKFADPPIGEVDCFAAYTKGTKFYVAEWDLDSSIIFEKTNVLNDLSPYASYDFAGGDTWICRAFKDKLMLSHIIINDDLLFYVAVAPKGENGIYQMQGAIFKFVTQ